MEPEWQFVRRMATVSLQNHNDWTHGHCSRVARYASRFAHYLELPQPLPLWLFQAGYLHDWGKVTSASEEILAKPLPTQEDWDKLTKHPEHSSYLIAAIYGYTIKDLERLTEGKTLSELPDKIRHIWFIVSVVRAHHCNVDRSGYPSRICRTWEHSGRAQHCLWLADRFDAMVSYRPYSPVRLDPIAAIEELINNAHAGQLSMEIVLKFKDAWECGALGR